MIRRARRAPKGLPFRVAEMSRSLWRKQRQLDDGNVLPCQHHVVNSIPDQKFPPMLLICARGSPPYILSESALSSTSALPHPDYIFSPPNLSVQQLMPSSLQPLIIQLDRTRNSSDPSAATSRSPTIVPSHNMVLRTRIVIAHSSPV